MILAPERLINLDWVNLSRIGFYRREFAHFMLEEIGIHGISKQEIFFL